MHMDIYFEMSWLITRQLYILESFLGGDFWTLEGDAQVYHNSFCQTGILSSCNENIQTLYNNTISL